MLKNNIHNNKLRDILLYLRNVLAGKEKNSVERKLQKDLFETEAMEGLQSINAEDVEEDLLELTARVNKRLEKKNRLLFYRIAASIAVIITISTLYFTLFDKKIGDLSLNQVLTESDDTKESESRPTSTLHDSASNTASFRSEKIEKDESPAEIPVEDVIRDFQTKKERRIKNPIPEIEKIDDEISILDTRDKLAEYPENEGIAENVTKKSNEKKTEKDASVSQAKKEEATATSRVTEQLRQSLSAKQFISNDAKAQKSEPIIIESIVSAEDSLSDSEAGIMICDTITIEYQGEYPSDFIHEFKNYIVENFVFPDTPIEKAIVVLNFRVSKEGRPSSIEVIRSPGNTFSREAIRLFNEGPDWLPADKEKNYFEEENRMMIIFRKRQK